jgi:proline dehydrogenase
MLVRDFIFWLSTKKGVTDAIARRGMRYGFARRFIAGESLGEALAASRELGRAGRRVSLNHLGENVRTAEEAKRAQSSYIEMVRELEAAGLDGNVSIKLTQLGLDVDRNLCQSLAGEIAAAAAGLGRTIEIDMEGSAYTDATLDIFEATRRRLDNVGLAIQAYLYRSEKDVERLALLHPKIRLVKGAYREPPNLAFQKKSDVDANYRRLLDLLLAPSPNGRFFPAIATHDPKMLDYAREQLSRRGFTADHYEFQMIYGVRRDLQQELREQGHPLRIYVPFGTQWCPYFMRRLAERPANCWFVLRSLAAESFRRGQRRG